MRFSEPFVTVGATAWRTDTTALQNIRERLLSRRTILFALALVTLLVFAPAIWNDFVDWDDQINLGNNEKFRGLGWAQIRWMFTSTLMGHYIPVTWLTFGLDYVLWGMDARGYHLTNVLLHAANAAVFYLVALRLLGRTLAEGRTIVQLCAAVAALFFALHPLRAESVAWATERRDVLSGLFALVTVLLYLKAAETHGRRRIRFLVAAVASYVLALGSKSIVMTLPFALLLLDFYPLRRLPASWRHWADASVRAVWREKIPFFALGALGALVSWYAVAANDFFTRSELYPLSARIGLTFYSLAFYVRKTVLPVGLTPLYELPYQVDLLAPRFAGSIAAVIVGGLALFAVRRRWPAGVAAFGYYAIAVAPVSGLLHAGHQLAHDRYSYLSCLGLALLVGALPATVLRLRRQRAVSPALTRVTLAGIGLWLAALGYVTAHQVQVWRDTETLWRYAVDSDDRCSLCHHNLGYQLLTVRKAPHQGLPHIERALELRPDRTRINIPLGIAYARTGDPERALVHYERALAAQPGAVDVRVHQAFALLDLGRPEEAYARVRQAVMLSRHDPITLTHVGAILTTLNRPQEALGHLQRAIELDPDAPPPRLELGRTLAALGRYDEAREQYAILTAMDHPIAKPMAQALAARLIIEW